MGQNIMEQENTLCILLGRSNNNLINITEFFKNLTDAAFVFVLFV